MIFLKCLFLLVLFVIVFKQYQSIRMCNVDIEPKMIVLDIGAALGEMFFLKGVYSWYSFFNNLYLEIDYLNAYKFISMKNVQNGINNFTNVCVLNNAISNSYSRN
jgi:hypothetical protein